MDGSATGASQQKYALLAFDYQAFSDQRREPIDRRRTELPADSPDRGL